MSYKPVKKICEECQQPRRSVVRFKHQYFCGSCKAKHYTIIPMAPSIFEALNKIYVPKKCGKFGSRLYLPQVLIGKRIKVVLVDEIDKQKL